MELLFKYRLDVAVPLTGLLNIGSRAASVKRPLFSVDVSVCVSVCRQLWC